MKDKISEVDETNLLPDNESQDSASKPSDFGALPGNKSEAKVDSTDRLMVSS